MQPEPKPSPWRPALIIFYRISTWVVIPLVVALIVGKWLDTQFDTKPWIFLLLTGVAFVISIRAIIKVVKKYISEIEKEAKDKKTFDN